MKTFVVLSALACVAIAAPAVNENEWTLDTPTDINPINFDSEIATPAVSARSHLGLKSPIIVKKKTGYHLYRDSAEERANAEPHENCSKHLRVKLCDENTAAKAAKATTTEDINDHKDDVEHSIKIAKEAVESLQHDLHNIEHESSAKNAQWKHGEADKNIHEDIKVASHALEHAQRSFGNLESMNLRAATLKDTEELKHQMEKAKTDEERYAQWKEAMENIQRNVEIARNIEDSFRSSSDFSEAEAIDTSKFMRINDHELKDDNQKLSVKEAETIMTSNRKTEDTDQRTMGKKSEHHTTTMQRTHESISHDMNSAASEIKDIKQEHHQQATEEKLAEVSSNVQSQSLGLKQGGNIELVTGKSIEMDTTLRASHPGVKTTPHATSMSLKMEQLENGHHKEESSSRTVESTHHLLTHKDESHMENIKLESMNGKSVAKEWEADKHSKHEKSAWAETENKELIMKAAEHKNLALNTHIKQDKSQNSMANWDANMMMKSADHLLEDDKQHKDDAKKPGVGLHSDMKLADNTELTSDITLNNPLNLNLDKGANLNVEHLALEKSAGDLHMDQLRHAHELSHAHAHAHAHAHMHGIGSLSHPLHKHELIGSHGHKLIKNHHIGGYHGKSAEIDSVMHPSMQMHMREFDEKAALENMLQWKHHDTARSYGAGLSYGGGLSLSSGGGAVGEPAVGVFPNAKIGGCAIPLLLSCSPSVVSGSLKSHGYAAPSYRHGEDFKFKNKRDIFKANDISGTKIRHSTKTAQPKNHEKKL